MPEQNLNPDALQAAADKLREHHIPLEGLGIGYDEAAALAVSTYSAALPAQPDTVNSVEELEALPVGTIIEDSEPCVLRLSPDSELWFVPGSTQG